MIFFSPHILGVRMKEYDFSSANAYLKGNLQKTGPISDTVMKGMKYYLGMCVL